MSDYTEPLGRMLADAYRTIRYQQRGLAPSVQSGPYTVEAHVDDAVRVLDALEIERAWAIGHSWGGHLAFHLAVARPERLLGLVAIDPLGAVPDGGWADLDRNIFQRFRERSAPAAARAQELDERATAGEASDAEMLEAVRLVWPYYFADPDAAPPMPDLHVSVSLFSGVASSIHEHFERGTLTTGLPRYDGPLLIVHGEQDPLPLEASRATAALVAHAVLVPIAEAGHFPWLERAEQLDEAVRGFMSSAAPS